LLNVITLQSFVAVGDKKRAARRFSLQAISVMGMTAAMLAGCSTQDRMCSSGQYPVKAVGNTTGGECVRDDKKPPEGYVRYPQGKVPQYVDDKWDKYWSTKIVDVNGNIVKG
jgi:hypothetical protein